MTKNMATCTRMTVLAVNRLFYSNCSLYNTSRICSNTVYTHASLQKYHAQKLAKKQNRLVEKMVYRKQKSQKFDPTTQGTITPFRGGKSHVTPGSKRRAKQLSVVLYEYITGLVNSGEVDPRLVEYGVEISQVKMSPDFSVINVCWVASGTGRDDKLQEILQQSQKKLRSLLMHMNVMGNLPPIQFIKEMSTARIKQVETLLKEADYGEDFTPTDPGDDLQADIVIESASMNQSKISEITKEFQKIELQSLGVEGPGGTKEIISGSHKKLTESDKIESEQESDTTDNDMGYLFRNDLYNIDHKKLAEQVLLTKKRSQDRNFDGVRLDLSDDNGTLNMKQKEFSKEEIGKFLANRKKQIKKEKANKMNKNDPLLQQPNGYVYQDHYEEEDYYEEDYIDDDFENYDR